MMMMMMIIIIIIIIIIIMLLATLSPLVSNQRKLGRSWVRGTRQQSAKCGEVIYLT